MTSFENLVKAFSHAGLLIPWMPEKVTNRLVACRDWGWSTDPTHDFMMDYMLEFELDEQIAAYQPKYAISHAGHGMNSYSLNLHVITQNLDFVVQVGWGGAFMEKEKSRDAWNQLVLGSLPLLNALAQESKPFNPGDKLYIRYSDFRGIGEMTETRSGIKGFAFSFEKIEDAVHNAMVFLGYDTEDDTDDQVTESTDE